MLYSLDFYRRRRQQCGIRSLYYYYILYTRNSLTVINEWLHIICYYRCNIFFPPSPSAQTQQMALDVIYYCRARDTHIHTRASLIYTILRLNHSLSIINVRYIICNITPYMVVRVCVCDLRILLLIAQPHFLPSPPLAKIKKKRKKIYYYKSESHVYFLHYKQIFF